MIAQPALDEISEAEDAQRAADAEQYRALAYRIARGEQPSTEEVVAILRANNKDSDALRELVQVCERRIGYMQQLDDADAAEERLPKAQQELAAVAAKRDAAITAAEDEYRLNGVPLELEVRSVREAIGRRLTASRELRFTCPDPRFERMLQENQRQLGQLSNAINALAGERATQETNAQTAEQQKEPDRAKESRAAADRLTARIAELTERQTAINAQCDEILVRMTQA